MALGIAQLAARLSPRLGGMGMAQIPGEGWFPEADAQATALRKKKRSGLDDWQDLLKSAEGASELIRRGEFKKAHDLLQEVDKEATRMIPHSNEPHQSIYPAPYEERDPVSRDPSALRGATIDLPALWGMLSPEGRERARGSAAARARNPYSAVDYGIGQARPPAPPLPPSPRAPEPGPLGIPAPPAAVPPSSLGRDMRDYKDTLEDRGFRWTTDTSVSDAPLPDLPPERAALFEDVLKAERAREKRLRKNWNPGDYREYLHNMARSEGFRPRRLFEAMGLN